MSWPEEDARKAARLERDQAWAEHFRGQPAEPAPSSRCECGCRDPLAARPRLQVPPESSQPAAVLLSWHLGHRAMPGDAREEARYAAVAELAEPRLDGRAALRLLATGRNPDGSPKSGSAALAAMRDLGIAGVGHERSAGL